MLKNFLEDSSPKNQELKNLYLLIHQFGPISRAELLEKTKMKQTKLAGMIEELLNNKFIYENGFGESAGGRPPVLYQIEPKCSYIIGVYISRLETRVVLIDLQFNIIDLEVVVMTSMHTPMIVISKVKQTINNLLEKYTISIHQLLGIGIGSSGSLQREKGIIRRPEFFFAPGWGEIPIVDILAESFPIKIMLEFAVNTAVLGEYRYSSLPFNHILYCMSGLALGCGVITNGELVYSEKFDDVMGYGHMIIDADGRLCSCGKRGCLISYTSPYAILEELTQKDPLLDWEEADKEKVDIDHIIEFLKQGDSQTEEIVLKSAYYLGIGVANMVNLLHSEYIILNGPLIHEYPHYYEEVIESALHHLYKKEGIKFSKGSLKENAAAVGSAILVFDNFFQY